MVGLKQNRSIQDEKLVEAIFTSTCISTIDPTATINLIIDARPTANAMAQTALGAGTESVDHYHRCRIAYLGIDNIHVVRDSMGKLLEGGLWKVLLVLWYFRWNDDGCLPFFFEFGFR